MSKIWTPILLAGALSGQPATELFLRGHSVIPTPRHVRLVEGDVTVDASWRLDAGKVPAQHIAIRTLAQDLEAFHKLRLRSGAEGAAVRLAVAPGTVSTGAAAEIEQQAYRLRLGEGAIEITGNADAGLFYGVQTLIQLLKRDAAGRLVVPKGVIEDWPSLQLRFLHWDTKHHQDRMETLKRYLDWAARFKANMIGFELEDKFEYPSNPVIGAPGAFTAAQLQEIVNYGLERFIQVVPNIQSPAHMAYVLKHPRFAHLRADGNNYQACLCDPRALELIFTMYDDVIRATRGIDYLFVSTDEVYYAGICSQCTRPFNPVNRSLAWVEFVQKANEHLVKRGRKMLIWAEYPLLAEHAKMLPRGIIDGVMGNPGYAAAEKELGIRQLAYVSMQGDEKLFPNHLPAEAEGRFARGRLQSAMDDISSGRVWKGDPIGAFGAAWDDSGLHGETFWLGWSTVAQYAWTTGTPGVEQHAAEFMNVYYGPSAQNMIEIYRMMQIQARAWERCWERVPSRVRGRAYGNSEGKGVGGQRSDATLEPPAIPAMPDLAVKPQFGEKYRDYIATARERMVESDRLIHALAGNILRVERNRYNLEVFQELARFMRHHWNLILALNRAEQNLLDAHQAALKKEARRAVGLMLAAYDETGRIQTEAPRVFKQLTAVFEKSRYPKGQSVAGKQFVHIMDDVKDHWADRRADLSYMTAAEESIGIAAWRKKLYQVLQEYAKKNNVPVRRLEEEEE